MDRAPKHCDECKSYRIHRIKAKGLDTYVTICEATEDGSAAAVLAEECEYFEEKGDDK